MTADQRRLVSELFDELVEVPPEGLPAALGRIDDAQVRAEVASLLQHVGGGGTQQLDETVAGVVRDAASSGAFEGHTVGPGSRFGPYRIERKLGQGGMGEVYAAVREDDFQKRVALKIVRYGLDSAFAKQRFEHERQLLAGLEHAYIARLLDGGAAEGVPYLVLEYVEGQTIDAYCEGRPVEENLRLFLKVCEAVDYAHRNLIIHRDLKPANIMVTTGGDPKLLDFGIAKLADDGLGVTRTMHQAMTPQYASPEQIRNEHITVASDVYSLGLVLYELLAGRKPYSLTGNISALEMHRMVCEVDPPRPHVSGDLDNIVLMALRKDPARRYRSARELADDIERSLTDRPVLARPDTFQYRAGKFIRRNRLALAAAAVLMIAITAGVAESLYQANLARQRFDQVRKLARTFVFEIHDEIAKVDGTTAARQLVVKTAVEYLDQLSKSAGGDAGLREELANAYVKVANAQGYPGEPNLGKAKDALVNYAKAEPLFVAMAADDPSKLMSLVRFRIRHGMLKALTGDVSGADAHYVETKRILEPLVSAPDAAFAAQYEYTRLLAYQANLLNDSKGDAVSGAALLEKANEMADILLTRERTLDTLKLAQVVLGRRAAIAEIGQLKASLSFIERERGILAELLQLEPGNPVFRRQRALNQQTLSVAWYDDFNPSMENPKQSAVAAQRYLELAQETATADPRNTAAQFSLAIAKSRLAAALRFENATEAEALAKQAVEAIESFETANSSYLNQSRIPRLRRIHAETLIAKGDTRAAVAVADRGVTESRALVAQRPKDEGVRFYLLANLYTAACARLKTNDTLAARERLLEADYLLQIQLKGVPDSLLLMNTRSKILTALAQADPAKNAEWSAASAGIWKSYSGPKNDFVSAQLARIR